MGSRAAIAVFSAVLSSIGFSHDSDKGYFDYYLDDDVYVIVELPWTLKAAVVDFDSTAQNAPQKKLDQITIKYFTENLTLKTEDEDLSLLSMEELKSGHSGHAITYRLDFEDGGVSEVCNTILFNLSDSQINYNTVHRKSDDIHFESTVDNACYIVEKKNAGKWWYLLLVIPIIVGTGLQIRRNSKK